MIEEPNFAMEHHNAGYLTRLNTFNKKAPKPKFQRHTFHPKDKDSVELEDLEFEKERQSFAKIRTAATFNQDDTLKVKFESNPLSFYKKDNFEDDSLIDGSSFSMNSLFDQSKASISASKLNLPNLDRNFDSEVPSSERRGRLSFLIRSKRESEAPDLSVNTSGSGFRADSFIPNNLDDQDFSD